MERDFREALKTQVLFFDGAMGTELYSRGVFINRSYDQLNLVQPELVRAVHRDYVKAGVDVVTTNTFGANRYRLQPFGLDEQLETINRRGVQIARDEAGEKAWVAGSIGPTGATLTPVGKLAPGDASRAFAEQARILVDEGVDLLILETFISLEELWQAVRGVRRAAPHVPIVACMTFSLDLSGNIVTGPNPEIAARTMAGWGIDAIGCNCSDGPQAVLKIVNRMVAVCDLPIAAMPNAGLPQEVDGRTLYLAGPEYMAEYARRYVNKGATLIGGCCGTTPSMLREMKSFVRSVVPGIRSSQVVTEPDAVTPDAPQTEEPVPIPERSEFARRLYSGKFCISVELDPPRGMDPTRSVEGGAFLYENGIDVINIADGPRAMARMGPSAMAQLVNRRCGMESVIHYCCRDRNLLGMQMDLLGAHALGMHNILAVTGDPPKMGNYPNATAVFDIDSIGLIHFIQRMNRGLDFAGRPMGGKTNFFVGAGCNPAHPDLDREVDRFGQKIEAGAEFFFSQPVYDPDILFRFLEMTEQFPKVPFLVGILPLASYKNAEFLHNEVPGMQVPQEIRDRLKAAPDKRAQRRIGVQIARQALLEAKNNDRIHGAYVYPPFGSYKAVLRVIEPLGDREAVRKPMSAG